MRWKHPEAYFFQFSSGPFIPFMSYDSSVLCVLQSFFSWCNFLCLFCWLKMAKRLSRRMALHQRWKLLMTWKLWVGWFRGNLRGGCNHVLLLGAKVQLHRFHYNTLVLVALKDNCHFCLIAGNFSLGRRQKKNLLSDLCMLPSLAYALCLLPPFYWVLIISILREISFKKLV